MNDDVKPAEAAGGGRATGKRPYNAPRRAERAQATRRAVLRSARELFVQRGYVGTTIADIAARAGVAADTVYAAVGRKPALLRELVETSLSGTDRPVAAGERDYVKRIRAASGARAKLSIYASAVAEIQQRLAPVFMALQQAALTDPDCAALWSEISERRARNMREFAADLRATGDLRTDLSDEEVGDIIWSMNAAEYYALLVAQRGWRPDRFGEWLADAWARMLIADSTR